MQINLSLTSLINPTPEKSYALNHFLIGFSVQLLTGYIGLRLGWGHFWIVGTVIVVAFAIWKEFFYDPKQETKDVSGGWKGDIEDFLEYLIGCGAALLVILG